MLSLVPFRNCQRCDIDPENAFFAMTTLDEHRVSNPGQNNQEKEEW